MSPLPNGRYVIVNYARDRPVGHGIGAPIKLPIRLTIGGLREAWDVEHVEGNLYLLTLNGFVTKAEGDSLWSYAHGLFPGVKGTKWIIEQDDEANHSTITDPEGKGWTLRDGDDTVTLDPVPGTGDPATQLWLFEQA